LRGESNDRRKFDSTKESLDFEIEIASSKSLRRIADDAAE
jgi:hypothetical protein